MEKVSNLLCKSCGFQVSENDSYCQKCGGKLLKQSTSFLGQYSNFTKVAIFLISTTIFLVVLFLVKGKEATPSNLSSSDSPTADTQQAENNLQAKTKNWVEYDAVNGYFKILFPESPAHNSEKGLVIEDSDITYDFDTYYNDFPDGTEYNASVYQFATDFDVEQTDLILEAFTNEVKIVTEGELVDSTYVVFKNNRAIKFLVLAKGNNSYHRGLIFLVGNKDGKSSLYRLTVTYKQENENLVQFEKFSNSFTLK